jgi:hypothetical protein
MNAAQIEIFRALLEQFSCRYGKDQIITAQESRVQLLLTCTYRMPWQKWWAN